MGYTLGLDIGITSIGWAVLQNNSQGEPIKIQDLGVRIFDAAEQPKTGASLALPRREARSARRRIRRRRHRKERIRQLLISNGVIVQERWEPLFENTRNQTDVYTLRQQGLDRLLTNEEWTRVLIHLAQRRGYHSNSTAEASKDKETGILKQALDANRILMEKQGYRTVGEMFCMDAKFFLTMPDGTLWRKTRNSQGDYQLTVTRELIAQEVTALFDAQRKHSNPFATEDLQNQYTAILLSQRNFDEGPGGDSPYRKNDLRGLCTFEREAGELRAYKATYTFEYFRLLTDINHIKITSNEHAPLVLTPAQRELIIAQCMKSDGMNFAKLRKLLNLADHQRFNRVRYGNLTVEEAEKKQKFNHMQSYHKLRKALDKISKNLITTFAHEQLDEIATILSLYKADDKRRDALSQLGLTAVVTDALLPLSFAQAGNLSLVAMRKLIPHLEQGVTYDVACSAVYSDHRGHQNTKRYDKLSFGTLREEGALDTITNPVVLRAISQTCKVVNAVIRTYGQPQFIRLELTREMSKNFQDRQKAVKSIDENTKRNERAKDHIEEIKQGRATGLDLVKWKLFQEQGEVCLYSGTKLSSSRLFEPGYVDIDHIIPYSISFDDSYQNKVLVLAEENRQKGNRLPLEYMAGDATKTQEYIVRVESSIHNYRKRQRLLKQTMTAEEQNGFKDRNLVDTQYITKAIYNILKDHLTLDTPPEGKTKQVFAVNGVITDYIRKRLGLRKVREDGDLHHAMDATVVAVVSDGTIQKISRYAKRREWKRKDGAGGYLDDETGEIMTQAAYDEKYAPHFPEPWALFRKELEARLAPNADQEIQHLHLATYDSEEFIKPVFVSRMPNRKTSGAAHKETIRSGKESGVSIVKTPLTSLKLDKNGLITPPPYGCDRLLHDALLTQLKRYGGDGTKAFAQPFYKPKADGTPGPVVHKVKTSSKTNLNVAVNGGIADNGGMVRIDVFYVEDDGYYFVPIYTSDVIKTKLPNKAVVAAKPYEEWKEMSPSDFIFTLYPGDLIGVTGNKPVNLVLANAKSTGQPELSRKEWMLYYRGSNIHTGAITAETHDRKYVKGGMGIKSLRSLEKYQVDVLGNYHKVSLPEVRQTFH